MKSKAFSILLFSLIFCWCFISATAQEPDLRWRYTSDTKIQNGRFDGNGQLVNGTLLNAEFIANGTRFDATVVNYQLTDIRILGTPEVPERPVIDLVPMAERMNSWMINPAFWVAICVLFAIMFRSYYHMMHEPYLWVRKFDDLKDTNIGRFIKEDPVPNTGLWKYYLKDYNGVHVYYSDRSFSEYAPFCFGKLMQIWHFYPDLIFTKIKVPQTITIGSTQIISNLKNNLLKIVYAFCSLLSLINWSIKIYSKFEFESGKLDEIPFLMNVYMMEQLDLRFKIKYKKFELDKETGVEQWNEKTHENLPMSEVLAILKNKEKVEDFQYLEIRPELQKYATIHECVKDLRTKLMDRAFYESRKLFYERAVQDTYVLYKQVAEELTTLKLTEEERFHEMYAKIDAVNTDRNNSLPEILAMFNRNRNLGMDDSEAIKKAVLNKIDQEYGTEKTKLMTENAELKARITLLDALLKDKLRSFESNQITVRNLFEPQSPQPQPNTEVINQ